MNTVTNGVPLFAFPNPFPSSLTSARPPSQSVTGYPLNPDNGKIHQFNVTIEQQFHDIGFRLSYVGSRNVGMNYAISVNKPQPSLIPFTAARRPFPQIVNATYYRNDGEQKFNAMTFEVQRKTGQVTFDAHWTWSSNYDNTLNVENPYSAAILGAGSLHAAASCRVERGLADSRRQRAAVSSSAHPALVNGVLGGWQLYWIGYLETGHYFSPTFSGSDPSEYQHSGGTARPGLQRKSPVRTAGRESLV